jgi:hypothetical protein
MICTANIHFLNQPSMPEDPEARSLIVGIAIAGYCAYQDPEILINSLLLIHDISTDAISAWSQVLIWPAKEAPFCELKSIVYHR